MRRSYCASGTAAEMVRPLGCSLGALNVASCWLDYGLMLPCCLSGMLLWLAARLLTAHLLCCSLSCFVAARLLGVLLIMYLLPRWRHALSQAR